MPTDVQNRDRFDVITLSQVALMLLSERRLQFRPRGPVCCCPWSAGRRGGRVGRPGLSESAFGFHGRGGSSEGGRACGQPVCSLQGAGHHSGADRWVSGSLKGKNSVTLEVICCLCLCGR
jgi:hypothetical protein